MIPVLVAACAIVKKIPWQVYACSGVLLLSWFIYYKGQQSIQVKWDASVERGREAVSRLKQRQTIVTKEVEIVNVEKVKVIREKGETVIKYVDRYISASDSVPVGFGMLYDSSLSGTLPGAPEGADGKRIPLRDAAPKILGNNTTCLVMQQDLFSLRQWVQRQREAYLAECKQRGLRCT